MCCTRTAMYFPVLSVSPCHTTCCGTLIVIPSFIVTFVDSLNSVQMGDLQRSPTPSHLSQRPMLERSGTEGSLSLSTLTTGFGGGVQQSVANGARKHSLPSAAHHRPNTLSRSIMLPPMATRPSTSPRGSFSQLSQVSGVSMSVSQLRQASHSMPRPGRPTPPMLYRTNSQASSQRASLPTPPLSSPASPLQRNSNTAYRPTFSTHSQVFHTPSRISTTSSTGTNNSDFLPGTGTRRTLSGGSSIAIAERKPSLPAVRENAPPIPPRPVFTRTGERPKVSAPPVLSPRPKVSAVPPVLSPLPTMTSSSALSDFSSHATELGELETATVVPYET